MKKLSIIFFIFISVLKLSGQDEYYEIDHIQSTVRSYYEDGTLASEINYINNQPVGIYRFYYPDGTLMEEGEWSEKHLTGNFKRYYSNGQVAQEFYFDEEGNRIGTQKYFSQSGKIQAKKELGPPESFIVRYTKDGKEKVYISF